MADIPGSVSSYVANVFNAMTGSEATETAAAVTAKSLIPQARVTSATQMTPKWNPANRQYAIPATDIYWAGQTISLGAGIVTIGSGHQILLLPVASVSGGSIAAASLVQDSGNANSRAYDPAYIPLAEFDGVICTPRVLPPPISGSLRDSVQVNVVSASPIRQINVILPGTRYHSDAALRFRMSLVDNIATNNSEVWRISAFDIGTLLGFVTFSAATSLTANASLGASDSSGGEWEFACLTVAAGGANYVGGLEHGNERVQSADWYVDGIKVTGTVADYVCQRFALVQNTIVYEFGSTTTVLCNIWRKHEFTVDGWRLTTHIEWAKSATITECYVGMISSRQSLWTGFIRHPKYTFETFVDGVMSSVLTRTDRIDFVQGTTTGPWISREVLNPLDNPNAELFVNPFTSGVAKLKAYPSVVPTGGAVTNTSKHTQDLMFRFGARAA